MGASDTSRKSGAGSFPAVLLLILAAAALLWFPLVTGNNLRVDSERMIYHAGEAMEQYRAEGRTGLVQILALFGLTRRAPV